MGKRENSSEEELEDVEVQEESDVEQATKRKISKHRKLSIQSERDYQGGKPDESGLDEAFPKTVFTVPAKKTTFGKKGRHLCFVILPLFVAIIISATCYLVLYEYYNDLEEGGEKAKRWSLLAGTVTVSFLLIRSIIKLIWFLFARFFFFSRFYYYFNELDNTVALLIWAVLNWPVFEIIIDANSNGVRTIRTTFIVLIVVSSTRCIKLVADKVLIARFHKDDYWEQIRESLKKERVLSALTREPGNAKVEGGKLLKKIQHPTDINKVWHFIKDSVDEEIKRDAKTKGLQNQRFRNLAVKLFKNVDKDKKGFIDFQDVEPFFIKKADAEFAFKVFDEDGNGTITMDEVIATVAEILKARKKLYCSLHDRENVGEVATWLLGVIYWIIMSVVIAVIYGADVTALFVPLGTFLVAWAFVFGSWMQTVWESFIYIFVIRPYDVGDRIRPDGHPTCIVSRINLLTTEAYEPNGAHRIIPHKGFTHIPITQMARSKDYAHDLNIEFSYDTPTHKIDKLEERLIMWFKTDTEYKWKSSSALFWLDSLKQLNRFQFNIWVDQIGVNHQSPARFLCARTRILKQTKAICDDLGIVYHMPPQPVSLMKKNFNTSTESHHDKSESSSE